MLKMVELDKKWHGIISQWPQYAPPFEELDYALREGGWLDTIGKHNDCFQFGFFKNSQLVGFSLLDCKSHENAEIFLAIHGDWVNHGIGGKICLQTLKHGFEVIGLCRIYLKVRINHAVGIHLYSKIGFKTIGETWEVTNGTNTHFYLMEIYKSEFISLGIERYDRTPL